MGIDLYYEGDWERALDVYERVERSSSASAT